MCTVQYFIIQCSIAELHAENGSFFWVQEHMGHHVPHNAPSYWMYKNRTFKKNELSSWTSSLWYHGHITDIFESRLNPVPSMLQGFLNSATHSFKLNSLWSSTWRQTVASRSCYAAFWRPICFLRPVAGMACHRSWLTRTMPLTCGSLQRFCRSNSHSWCIMQNVVETTWKKLIRKHQTKLLICQIHT